MGLRVAGEEERKRRRSREGGGSPPTSVGGLSLRLAEVAGALLLPAGAQWEEL